MSQNFSKQLPVNLISNVIYFILNVIIGIWMVPYLIKHVGTEAYGFIPLAVSLTSYIGLVTLSLNLSVSRFLTIDLEKGDIHRANQTFNTAFIGLCSIVLFVFPFIVLFSIFLPKIFNVPSSIQLQVQWLFFFISASFLVSVLASVFSVSTFVNNRLDLRNLIDILNLLTRTLTIIVLFLVAIPTLYSIGLAYVLGSVVGVVLSYFIFRKLTPNIRVSFKSFDKLRFKELMSMGSWVIINQIGSLLFLQIDLIVVNLLFGAHQAGEYGALIQWNFLLRSLGGVFAGALAPMLFISHAKEDKERMITLSSQAVKFLGIGLALPIGLICGFAKPILLLWLGESYVKYVPLLWLLTAHLVVNLAVLPLFSINQALNKVKYPAIITLVMGILNLVLAICFAKYLDWGIYGVAAAGALVLTLKNGVFTTLYAADILHISKNLFLSKVLNGFLYFLFIISIISLYLKFIIINTFTELFIALVVVTFIYFIFLMFSRSNRTHILSVIGR